MNSVEKITKYALWAMMGISIVILILFFAIGYDRDFEENPKFNDPVLTDALLIWTYILVGAAVIVTVWSLIHSLTTKGTGTSKDTGIAGKTDLIAWGICVVSLVVGAVIGFASKGEQLFINGKWMNDANNPATDISTDIIITDISLVSIIVLLVVTIAATAFSMVKSSK